MPVVQGACDSGLNSQWRFTDNSNGYVRVLAQHSGKCLDVSDNSTANGAEVKQYDCGSGDNQRWRFESLGDGYVRIVAKHSNKCLDTQDGSPQAGAHLVQTDCGVGAGQAWKVTKVGAPTDPTDPTDPSGGDTPGKADQQISTSVKPGVLTMTASTDAVRLPPVAFGAGGASTGALNPALVKDFRGGTTGWSLTGKVTDFSGPHGRMDSRPVELDPDLYHQGGEPEHLPGGKPRSRRQGRRDPGVRRRRCPDRRGVHRRCHRVAGRPEVHPVGDYTGTLTLTLL